MKRAELFIELLNEGEFAKVANQFIAPMHQSLSPANLKKMWEDTLGETGPYKQQVASRTDTLGRFRTVHLTCEFARAKWDAQMVFNTNGKIAGLFFGPIKNHMRTGAEEIWDGAPKVGATEIRVVFHLFKQDDGNYAGTMDSPDQGFTDLVFDQVSLAPETIRLQLKRADLVFEGTRYQDGREIAGNLTQYGKSYPLTIRQVSQTIIWPTQQSKDSVHTSRGAADGKPKPPGSQLEDRLVEGSVWKGSFTFVNGQQLTGEWELYVQERTGHTFKGVHWAHNDKSRAVSNFMKTIEGTVEGNVLTYHSTDPSASFTVTATLNDDHLEARFAGANGGVAVAKLKQVAPRPKVVGPTKQPKVRQGPRQLDDLIVQGSVWKGSFTFVNGQHATGEWELYVQERTGHTFKGVHWAHNDKSRAVSNFMKTIEGTVEGNVLSYHSTDPSASFTVTATLNDDHLEARFAGANGGVAVAKLRLEPD